MSIADLINELEVNNINISLNRDDIEVSFDGQEIDAVLVDKIRQQKSELLVFLKRYAKDGVGSTILPLEKKESYALSHNQKRIWILSQFTEGAAVWNMPLTIHLEDTYDLEIFKKAVHAVIKRHEILRTVFKKDSKGEPRQWILSHEELKFSLGYHDFGSADDSEINAFKYVNRDASNLFDLEKGPLMRGSILKIKGGYIFYFNIHHIISDGWSLEVIETEIKTFYDAYRLGKKPNLPELKIQYKDFAAWQLSMATNEAHQLKRDFWMEQFSGEELPLLDLPSSKIRPKVMTHNGHYLRTFLTANTATKMKQFSLEQGGSLFMFLLSAWNILFYRYLNQEDLILGTLVAGREHAELENQIGYYVNTLALRNKVNPEASFHEFFNEVKQSTLSAFSNQSYSFDALLEDLDMSRDISRTPIFDILLVLHNIKEKAKPYETLSMPDQLKIYDFGFTASKFAMEIEFKEMGGLISFDVKYNTDVYERALIENLIRHFRELITNILKNPKEQVKNIGFLVEEERDKLVNTYNDTQSSYPTHKRIIDFFEEQVLATPKAVAAIDANKNITYEQLDIMASTYAMYLTNNLGLEVNDKVVVSLPHEIKLITTLLALKKIGAIYIPIDPETPNNRIDYIFDISQSKFIIDNSLCDKIILHATTVKNPQRSWDRLGQDDIEFIMYTSGSTGVPKGVLLKSTSVNNRLNWMWNNYPFRDNEVCCAKTSISFVDHIWEFFGPLLMGIPLVFLKKKELIDIPSLINTLSDYRVSRIVLVPTLLRALLRYPKLCNEKLKSLNIWISSGEALKKNDVQLFYKTMKREDVRLLNVYGSTEVTADATYYDTHSVYNTYKDFSLFETSLGSSLTNLITEHDANTKVVSKSIEELVQENRYCDVTPSPKFILEEYQKFLETEVLPNSVNVSAPTFIGHMTGPVPKFIREIHSLVTVLNQNQVKIETSMVSTLIEKQVVGIFHKLVYGEKKSFYDSYTQDGARSLGVITNGGTMSNIMAISYNLNNLLKARDKFRGLTEEGLLNAMNYYGYKKVALLGSKWCHYSFSKALKILGLGKDSFVLIETDDRSHDQIKQELELQIEHLNTEKTLILGIVGVAGATESGNIDPLEILGETAKKFQIHYHVDAAFGGAFLLDDTLGEKFTGIELADTVTICAHKQMYVPIGLSFCLFKDPDYVLSSENNTYYQARKESFDLGKFTVEGTRNFSSLVLHAVFNVLGKEGLAEIIRHNYKTAQTFANLIDKTPGFQLLYPPDLNIVLYRYVPFLLRDKKHFTVDELLKINDLNRKIQKQQFTSGNSFVSYTEIMMGGYQVRNVAFRAVFMNPYTSIQDLEVILEEQLEIAANLEDQNWKATPGLLDGFIPIGKPIENVQVYILDNHLNILPADVVGEICIGGDCISAGYTGDTNHISEKFVDNPFKKDQLLFRTGDLGKRLPDGNIIFVSRQDDQVKIRGHRVELGEVERALLKVETIVEVTVVHIIGQSNDSELAAYFVSKKQENPTELHYFLKEILPQYMIPAHFIPLAKMPVTSSGKINKKMLPSVDNPRATHPSHYLAPNTQIEKRIAAIWEELLGKKHIGLRDDFFVLGGHSLNITQLINDYHKSFNVPLSFNSLFEHTTLGEHARLINSSQKEDFSEISKVPKADSYPISFAQRRLWFLSQLEKESGAYNMPFEVKLEGNFNQKAFTKALEATIERHEILRTVFKRDANGDIKQWPLEKGDINFEVDYQDYRSNKEIDKDTRAYINNDSYKPFNLKEGPLLRTALIRVSNEAYIFYYNMHHIISDGVSLEILKRDVLEFYQAYRNDKTPNLPQLRIQYKDYAVWQLKNLESDLHLTHKEFWMEKFSKGQPSLKLSGKKTPPTLKSYSGNSLTTYISPEIGNMLRDFCRKQGGSIFVGALSVWKILFYHYSSQKDITIGTPVAGRDHENTKNLVGCFFNTTVIRSQLNTEDSFEENFQQIKDNVLATLTHSSYPFDKIVEDLKIKRTMDSNPLFDIMFSFHNTVDNVNKAEVTNVDQIVDMGPTRAKLDMLINFAEHGEHLFLNIEYNTSLYEPAFIKELMRSYKSILRMLLENPSKKISTINFREDKVKNLLASNQQKLRKLLK